MLLQQKKWPARQGQECLSSSYLRGNQSMLLIPYLYQQGTGALDKNKWGGHTEALITFLLLYFVCNVEYPKECLNVYLFLQRYILKVCDSARLPTKLLQFLNELNC